MKLSELETTKEFEIPGRGVKYRVRAMMTWPEAIEYSKLLKDYFDKKKTEIDVGKFMLSRLIVSWNLEDEDGNPLPINDEVLLRLPADIVVPMSKQIRRMIDDDYNRQSVKKKSWFKNLLHF